MTHVQCDLFFVISWQRNELLFSSRDLQTLVTAFRTILNYGAFIIYLEGGL